MILANGLALWIGHRETEHLSYTTVYKNLPSSIVLTMLAFPNSV